MNALVAIYCKANRSWFCSCHVSRGDMLADDGGGQDRRDFSGA